jgi:hypothetical protein
MNTGIKYILSALFLLVVVGVIWISWFSIVGYQKSEPIPNPQGQLTSMTRTDEHLTIDETLRDVNFCGKIYKVKQIKIDGVDVVQRVAELATKNLIRETLKIGPYGPKMDEWKTLIKKRGEMANEICQNISLNISSESRVIQVGEVNSFPSKDLGQSGDKVYTIQISNSRFAINPASNEIYTSSEYEGSLIGPIGTLK